MLKSSGHSCAVHEEPIPLAYPAQWVVTLRFSGRCFAVHDDVEGTGVFLFCAEEEKEIEDELEEGVENNAALLNSKSHETKGRRVTTSLAGLLLALVAGIFGGELPGLTSSVHQLAATVCSPD